MKGYCVRLGDPFSGRPTFYLAAESRGEAVSMVVGTAREHIAPEVGYEHVVSANRYPLLDGKPEGFHEKVVRILRGGIVA